MEDVSSGSGSGSGRNGREPCFKPSVEIRDNGDSSILIRTLVFKNTTRTSALFAILEDEMLDIVYENHYRTETKAAHSILVNNLPPGYDVESLKRRLFQWAGLA